MTYELSHLVGETMLTVAAGVATCCLHNPRSKPIGENDSLKAGFRADVDTADVAHCVGAVDVFGTVGGISIVGAVGAVGVVVHVGVLF